MDYVLTLSVTFWLLWSLYRPEWEAKAEAKRRKEEVISKLPRYPRGK